MWYLVKGFTMDDEDAADPSARDAQAGIDKACLVKVVMTGSTADGPEWDPLIRRKDKRHKLANRFKDAKRPAWWWITSAEPIRTRARAENTPEGNRVQPAFWK